MDNSSFEGFGDLVEALSSANELEQNPGSRLVTASTSQVQTVDLPDRTKPSTEPISSAEPASIASSVHEQIESANRDATPPVNWLVFPQENKFCGVLYEFWFLFLRIKLDMFQLTTNEANDWWQAIAGGCARKECLHLWHQRCRETGEFLLAHEDEYEEKIYTATTFHAMLTMLFDEGRLTVDQATTILEWACKGQGFDDCYMRWCNARRCVGTVVEIRDGGLVYTNPRVGD